MQAVAPRHGTALCATGLERSFSEIGRNVAGALRELNSSGALHIFGVVPANASWSPAVYSLLSPSRVAAQTPCHAPAGPRDLKWFTCTRGGGTTRGGRCADTFVQSLCDLQICQKIIHDHELQTGVQFRMVGRLRLDIAYEASIALPSEFDLPQGYSSEFDNTVWVPQMNSQVCARPAIARDGL